MYHQSRKLLRVALFVCLCTLLGTAALQADTVSGNQNPDLEVVVTLESSGSNPEMATVGDTLTATWTVINKTNKDLRVKVTHVWEPPMEAVHPIHRIVTIPANGAFTRAGSFLIDSSIAQGAFYFTATATDDFGKGFKSYSVANAFVTIY